MMMSNDSYLCLAILVLDDTLFKIKAYDLKTQELAFEKEFKGVYLRMNIIDQNKKGNTFAVGYQNNGQFYMQVFDNQGTDLATLDVNEVLEIDDGSKPVTGFYEPLITIAFKPDTT